MDDFFVYYEPMNDTTKGVIKAISPSSLTEMGRYEIIRISSEQGLSFTIGMKSLTCWMIKWNNDTGKMEMFEEDRNAIFAMSFVETLFFEEVPRIQTKPQLTITYSRGENSFSLMTRGISVSHQDLTMYFFVTNPGDPNILHHYFITTLYETMGRKGVVIPCNVKLPKKFSVFCKPELERYKLKVRP